MLRLYDSCLSGNSWKIRILLNQLERSFERVTLDLEAGETKTEAFHLLNRFGRIPVLQISDRHTIVESGAILLFLADGTPLLPDDPHIRSQVSGWLFFEQGDLQRPLALPRLNRLKGIEKHLAERLPQLYEEGYRSLATMESWLSRSEWLVGESYSIADLGVFAYVALAHEGGYDMGRFPKINEWLNRVRAQPGWIGIFDRSPFQLVQQGTRAHDSPHDGENSVSL